MDRRAALSDVLVRLRGRYGRIKRREPKTPFAWVLYENASYLVDDERRSRTFETLAKTVGVTPRAIADAGEGELTSALTAGGPMLNHRVEKLREAARIAQDEFHGDLDAAIAATPNAAEKYLRRFPSIGEPGAAKIVLFSGIHPGLTFDSNGMRVLLRLGYVLERPSYAANYRALVRVLEDDVPATFPARIEAFQLLKRHGQEMCKREGPNCRLCPIAPDCRYFSASS